MANQIKFTVGGISYAITSEDSEEYIRAIALELEHKMDRLARQNPFLSTTMVAVLAALDNADALKKAELENAALRKELKETIEDCVVARSNVEQLEMQLSEFQDQYDE